MKFSKFKKDERCKKLERSLKLSLLRKNGKLENDNLNDTDVQNWSFSAFFPQPLQTEDEIVPSDKNLPKIKAMKKNRCTTNELDIASNVQQFPNQNNSFENNASLPVNVNEYRCQTKRNSKIIQRDSLLTNENLSPVIEKSLSVQLKDIKYDQNFTRLQKEHSKSNNDNNYNPCKTDIASPKENPGRTFFNWKVMLNKDAYLIIKGTLER